MTRQRVSVAEIAAMTEAGGHLPATSARPAPPAEPAELTPAPAKPGRKSVTPAGYEVVPINFKCTPDMARLLARLAEPEGGIRRLIAKMLRDAGHTVNEHDLNPPTNRRWGGAD